jgi:hypothetical protein
MDKFRVLLTEALLPVSCTTPSVITLLLVSVIEPLVPALKSEFAPAAVVVKIEEPNWLIEPPTALTSNRLALAVGSVTLPAVALKTAGPPDVTEPPVELIVEPEIVTLPPEIAPIIEAAPVVEILITEPPRSERTGASVADTPPPPPKIMFGVDVKPEPPAETVTPVTEPAPIAALAAAPVPPPPLIVTLGVET